MEGHVNLRRPRQICVHLRLSSDFICNLDSKICLAFCLNMHSSFVSSEFLFWSDFRMKPLDRSVAHSFTYVCVSRDVWPGVWPLWDAGLRWREGEGVRNVSGIQHGHLGCCSTAGNARSAASDSVCVSQLNRQMYYQASGVIDSLFRGSDSLSARAGHAFVHLCPCVCCFSRRWVVWS